MSSAGEKRSPLVLDEADTVVYSGPYLAELLQSPDMRALAALDINVNATVVIPGSPSVTDQSSVSIAPVAYTLSDSVAVDPPAAPAPSRIGVTLSLAAFGIMVGLVGGTYIAGRSRDAAPAAAAVVREAARHERVEEKTPLVSVLRPKSITTPVRRHGRFSIAGLRAAPGPTAGATQTAPARSDESSSGDEDLIRAAQLERSL